MAENKSFVPSAEIINTIQPLWEALCVLPNVREHQARVAGIVLVLRKQWKANAPQVNWDDVIAAALTHDLGNIAKADLSTAFSQQLLGPVECERLEYWIEHQSQLREQFGNSELSITLGLMRQVGMSPRVQEIVANADFSHNPLTVASNDWERKILAHADHCVGPFSVLSLRERLEEGARRYGYASEDDASRKTVIAAYELATQIQSFVELPLDAINAEMVEPYAAQFLPQISNSN